MAGSLILIANPGSASRKYGLYAGEQELAQVHFEWLQGKVVCTVHRNGQQHLVETHLQQVGDAAAQVLEVLRANHVLKQDEKIARIGLRIVAPSAYFLQDHLIDDECLRQLQASEPRAPIHVRATLDELGALRQQFPKMPIAGISDSAFHCTKPDYAWNYGLPLELADHFDIKRFGYHGLSVASVADNLHKIDKLPPKLIVCHLGSGASVTAVHGGKSLDTTMGYSPLEGVIMSTRSGSIDPAAVQTLKKVCNFDDEQVEDYLNNHSGLLGLGGSSDIRELLQREMHGDHRARLALATYVYSLQKAIGQMAAALGGADAIVFTGTVGERSAVIRERVAARLHYLDFVLDEHTNQECSAPESVTVVSRLAHSKPIYVIPTGEAAEMVRRTRALTPA